MTLVSIVQALALEELLSNAFSADAVHGEGLDFVLRVLQIGGVFFMLVVVWHEYALGVVRFNYVVGLQDSLIPFAFGFSEFGLIEATYRAPLEYWFFWQALALGVGIWIYTHQMLRARNDPTAGDVAERHGRFSGPARIATMAAAALTALAMGALIVLERPSAPIAVALVTALLLGQVSFAARSVSAWTELTGSRDHD